MSKIPKNHPRYESLITREKITEAMKKGLVHETGLIAHGRGEAFDYLLGEKTNPFADAAEKVAAASLLIAEKPVISVNGNVVALAASECISLSKAVPAEIEVNLFHRTSERMDLLINELEKQGASNVLGRKGDARISNLEHDRGLCDKDGIFSSDVILVPLEDGDRCKALRKMGKTVIAIDLNPLSRTAKSASITIVDNVIRAVPNIEKWVKKLKNQDSSALRYMVDSWDNDKSLNDILGFISKRLQDID
jgi:4-phosphopantoate--beta-alanine ligase